MKKAVLRALLEKRVNDTTKVEKSLKSDKNAEKKAEKKKEEE